MSDVASQILSVLARTTLVLAVAALACAALLRLTRTASPRMHRLAWGLTLIAGWTFVRLSVPVSWYDAKPARVIAVSAVDDRADTGGSVDAKLAARFSEITAGESLDPAVRVEYRSLTPQKSEAPRTVQGPTIVAAPRNRTASWAISWPLVAVGCWAIGIGGLVTGWLVGYVRFVRSLPTEQGALADWLEQWREIMAAAGVRRPIRLRVVPDLGPMLCRLPRGYELIVPEDLWRELDPGQRAAILRHELAHYLRGDVWTSLVARALALPHWFNPASWWAVRRFEEAAEWSCDRAAAAGEPDTAYAKALVRLGELARPHRFSYGPAARGRSLAARIRRVLAAQTEDSRMKKSLFVAVAVCLAALPLVRVQLIAKEPAPALIELKDLTLSTPESDGQGADQPVLYPEPATPQTPTGPTVSPYLDLLQRRGSPARKYSMPVVSPAPSGPTVSPYLNLLQPQEPESDDADDPTTVKRRADGRPTVSPYLDLLQADENADRPRVVYDIDRVERDLQRRGEKTIDAARKAYEAALQNYRTGQGASVESVYNWSQRWTAAARSATRITKQMADASRAHLERMQELQKLVKKSVDAGQTSMDEMTAVNFYVAEAERRVEESPVKAATSRTGNPPLSPQARKDPELWLLQKKLATSPPRTTAGPSDRGAAIPREYLVYDGKTFSYWVNLLRTDLSIERRTEAMRVLAAFGANGYGREAAAAVLELMRNYNVFGQTADIRESKLTDAAMEVVKNISDDEALLPITEAMKSENANQRLFAVVVLPNIVAKRKDAAPWLTDLLRDENRSVRVAAHISLGLADPDSPELLGVLREELSGEEPDDIRLAISIAGGRVLQLWEGGLTSTMPPMPALAPQLVKLLDSTDKVIRNDATDALIKIGPAAIKLLEPRAASDDPEVAKHAAAMIEKIRQTEAANAER
jgi:beta-lactamase regulating signal transducer with metallopeptidase domain